MSATEWRRADGFVITTDIARFDQNALHDFLSNHSYWAKGIPRAVVDKSIANSLCFGVLDPIGEQAGFARVITDRATFAYVCDVFILPPFRRQGLSKWLMETMVDHPDLETLRWWLLLTGDAHELYAKTGFEPIKAPERYMQRVSPNSYLFSKEPTP